jgi:hypothetical protein
LSCMPSGAHERTSIRYRAPCKFSIVFRHAASTHICCYLEHLFWMADSQLAMVVQHQSYANSARATLCKPRCYPYHQPNTQCMSVVGQAHKDTKEQQSVRGTSLQEWIVLACLLCAIQCSPLQRWQPARHHQRCCDMVALWRCQHHATSAFFGRPSVQVISVAVYMVPVPSSRPHIPEL